MEQKFLLTVGLPASGKTTLAQELMEDRNDIVYLSSDLLRLELFGNIDDQEHNSVVFEEMRKRTIDAFKNGKHVIYDATNISRKRRRALLQQLPKDIHKTAVYMSTEFKTVIKQNKNRERVVPYHVIERMYKNLQIPIYSEGWDNIMFVYDDNTLMNDFPPQFSHSVRKAVLSGEDGYELMTFFSQYSSLFSNIYDMPQDSYYHSFSVSRHIYYVYKYVLDYYEGEDKELMLWTALLHDVGKAFCKSFINRKGEETRYANFIGHEYVGSQLAVNFLKQMNFTDKFIHKVVTLIQFHMYLLDKNANREKLKQYVGEDFFKKLDFLRKADTLAH